MSVPGERVDPVLELTKQVRLIRDRGCFDALPPLTQYLRAKEARLCEEHQIGWQGRSIESGWGPPGPVGMRPGAADPNGLARSRMRGSATLRTVWCGVGRCRALSPGDMATLRVRG